MIPGFKAKLMKQEAQEFEQFKITGHKADESSFAQTVYCEML